MDWADDSTQRFKNWGSQVKQWRNKVFKCFLGDNP